MSRSYRFRKIDRAGRIIRTIQGLEPELPRIKCVRGIERGLHAARDLEARPEFVGHEVRELHADAMHIFHRAAERQGASDDLIDRDGDRRARRRSILSYGSPGLEGGQPGLLPDAETEQPDAWQSDHP